MSASSIVLSNTALAAAGFVLGLPLLIHLLTRRTVRVMKFPSLAFLQIARASHSSFFRLRHWLLMLLRTLALAALVLAFLKPLLLSGALRNPRPGHKPAVAIVLVDASASMQYHEAGGSVFAQARTAAEQILKHLGPEDRANVILAGALPRPSLAEPSANRFHLLRDLQEAKPTSERLDADAAIAEAVNQLRAAGDAEPELHIVADFQRSSWASARFQAIPANVKTVFVPVGSSEFENTAISDVTVTPATPTPDEEVDVTCRVSHHGPHAREVALKLQLGDDLVSTRSLVLNSGESSVQSFRLRLGRRGFREGTLSIPEDRLPIDDRRYLVLNVVDQVRVTVVSDEVRRSGSVRRILQTALNPYRDTQQGAVACDVRRSDELGRPTPEQTQILIATDAQPWSAATLDHMLAYVQEGGSLLYFLATPSDAANILQLEARAAGALRLPFQPRDALASDQPGQRPAHLAAAQLDHPLLRKFRERTDLHEVVFHRHFRADRARDAGTPLLAYDDGSLALALQTFGAGQILLANFSPQPGHSDIATRNLFVPLLHEMMRALRPRQQPGTGFLAGGACSATVRGRDFTAGAFLAAPSGEREPVSLDIRRQEAAILLGLAREAGFYRVFAGDEHVASVAVNVDGRESEAGRLREEQLAELMKAAERDVMIAGDTRAEALQAMREGRPLWHFALLLVLGLLVAEHAAVLAWRR